MTDGRRREAARPEEQAAADTRFADPGIGMNGNRVIYDGEAGPPPDGESADGIVAENDDEDEPILEE